MVGCGEGPWGERETGVARRKRLAAQAEAAAAEFDEKHNAERRLTAQERTYVLWRVKGLGSASAAFRAKFKREEEQTWAAVGAAVEARAAVRRAIREYRTLVAEKQGAAVVPVSPRWVMEQLAQEAEGIGRPVTPVSRVMAQMQLCRVLGMNDDRLKITDMRAEIEADIRDLKEVLERHVDAALMERILDEWSELVLMRRPTPEERIQRMAEVSKDVKAIAARIESRRTASESESEPAPEAGPEPEPEPAGEGVLEGELLEREAYADA